MQFCTTERPQLFEFRVATCRSCRLRSKKTILEFATFNLRKWRGFVQSLVIMATSRMAFLDLNLHVLQVATPNSMFHKLPLQIQTIEGALQYKIAPLTPPKFQILSLFKGALSLLGTTLFMDSLTEVSKTPDMVYCTVTACLFIRPLQISEHVREQA